MNAMIRIAAVAILVLGMVANTAATTPISACNPASLYYANGVWNTLDDAHKGMEALSRRVVQGLNPAEFPHVTYTVSLNPTHGLPRDILEAVRQRFNLSEIDLWGVVLGFVTPPQPVKDFIAQRLAAAAADGAGIDSGAVGNIATDYSIDIADGRRVVVVSHSQGNFTVRQAANLLEAEELEHFSVVRVASPDYSSEYSLYEHTTLYHDLVIAAVPTPKLPANTLGIPSLADWKGHDFALIYMADGTNVSSRIASFAIDSMRSLPAPKSACAPPRVSATSSPNPSEIGEVVTLSGTMDTPNAKGSILFRVGPEILCTAQLSSGAGSCTRGFATSGTKNVVVEYRDSEGMLGATSSFAHVVNENPLKCALYVYASLASARATYGAVPGVTIVKSGDLVPSTHPADLDGLLVQRWLVKNGGEVVTTASEEWWYCREGHAACFDWVALSPPQNFGGYAGACGP
jgi:hypothetical protein